MNIALRLSLLAGIALYVLAIFFFLKKKRISLKYSLLWFLSSLVLLIMDLFPELVVRFAHLLGIEATVNAVFLIFIFLMLLLLISLTSIVSSQHSEIKALVQETAILRKEVEELRDRQ